MKKIFSFVLVLMLIFLMAVPSFASEVQPLAGDFSNELDALNDISYYVYWTFQDFTGFFNTANDWLSDIWQTISGDISRELTAIRGSLKNNDTSILFQVIDIATNSSNSLAQLLDINDFTRSSYDELKRIRENLFGETVYLQSFASVVSDNLLTLVSNENNLKSNFWRTDDSYQDSFYKYIATDLNSLKQREWALWNASLKWESYTTSWYYQVYDNLEMLQQVLADEDDLALKESQKSNQEAFEGSFMTGSSSVSSLGAADISALAQIPSLFSDFYSGSDSASQSISYALFLFQSLYDDSTLDSPLLWFSPLTAQSMDSTVTTFSFDDSQKVVTSYYQDNINKILSIIGDNYE